MSNESTPIEVSGEYPALKRRLALLTVRQTLLGWCGAIAYEQLSGHADEHIHQAPEVPKRTQVIDVNSAAMTWMAPPTQTTTISCR